MVKICTKCKEEKEEALFRKNKKNRDGLNYWCTSCIKEYFRVWYGAQKEAGKLVKYGLTQARSVMYSSVHGDRRRGRLNDLTLQFVEEMVGKECSYCLRKTEKMTLDRIDNSIGHTMNNVVPACSRCNWMRRDIPHAAWMALVPALRKAVAEGLFDGWYPGMGNGTKTWAGTTG